MKKVRLSKTKASKFNESGQLVAFYAVAVIWAASVFRDVSFTNCFFKIHALSLSLKRFVIKEGYFQSLNFFWTGYPHVSLTFMTKFFFIIQVI